jgi:hypothetical protein
MTGFTAFQSKRFRRLDLEVNLTTAELAVEMPQPVFVKPQQHKVANVLWMKPSSIYRLTEQQQESTNFLKTHVCTAVSDEAI